MRRPMTRVMIGACVGLLLLVGVWEASAVTAATPTTMQPAVANQITRFSGSGFNANEVLSFWVTAPDRTVTPLVSDIADGSGAFSISVSFVSDGFWQVTAHGTNTGKEVIGGFAVGNVVSTAVPGAVAADAAVPAGATAATVSQTLTFAKDGFRPLEQISFWTTAPDGAVTPLSGGTADVSGAVTISVSFATKGYWQVTAHGIESSKEAIGGYLVGDVAPPVAVTPLPGQIPNTNIVLQPTATVNPYIGAEPYTTPAPTLVSLGPDATPVAGKFSGTIPTTTSRGAPQR